MKYLIMCEGPNELKVANILLDAGKFIFAREDLLNLVLFHARQIDKSTQLKSALKMYTGNDVHIIRMGDKMSDKLRIPKDHIGKIQKVEKYCTKPELEILLIIGEGLLSKFRKVQSGTRAKSFAKSNIEYNGKRYDGSSSFYADYFEGRPDFLVQVIKEYKAKNGSHEKDELYLADLLK